MKGFLVLESGQIYPGRWRGGKNSIGEIVFNTSHFGYEEMATDPSYTHQILITTAPMQGNYGVQETYREAESFSIQGFICLEIQNSKRDQSWLTSLTQAQVPVLTDIDTRSIVLTLREQGTTWGALIQADSPDDAKGEATKLLKEKPKERDWCHLTSCSEPYDLQGSVPKGPRVAVIDLGSKRNILRELQKRTSSIRIFPSRTSFEDILEFNPHGLLLSNGPGDPADVVGPVETVQKLLGKVPIFGICMGHHILARALDLKTYKLKFGHRGGNHPIKDLLLDKIYVTSQNHGYAVDKDSLKPGVEVTHWNLNDDTISGIINREKNCMSVQFHPESRPGPHDAEAIFDYFIKQLV